MKIAVFASADSWHFLDLKRAAGDRHDLIACDFRSLTASVGSHGQQQFHAGSVDLADIGAVILRVMPIGSLQQIVLRMDILGSLQRSGRRIVNDPKTIEMAVDKYLTFARLAERRIPVPQTEVCECPSLAMAAYHRLGEDVVVKPLFGSMGQGIERISDSATAKTCFERLSESGEVCYVQKFIDHGDSDLRLLVIGDQVLGMRRTKAGHWLTNISSGAVGSPHRPTTCEVQLARKAAAAVNAEIAGVDLMYEASTGKPLVVEVNAAPGWQATSKALKMDVAALILDQVSDEVNDPSLM